MGEHDSGPGDGAGERVRIRMAEPPTVDATALKARIAETVRADSRERGAPTAEPAVEALAADLPRERLRELLAEMAAEEGYADLQAIVAPSGRIYLFSAPHLPAEQAAERCLREEVKIAIVEQVRGDSEQVQLTPETALDGLFPWPEPERRAGLLDELLADARYRDVQKVSGGAGVAVYYHSEAHLSGNYARIMLRAQASDPVASIAEFVRDRSRTMPAPTRITVFESPVFGVSAATVAEFVKTLEAPAPEHADLKKLTHPATGAVYLYSDRWLDQPTAFRLMDWEEVGRSQNP
jgi:hypothetical protein